MTGAIPMGMPATMHHTVAADVIQRQSLSDIAATYMQQHKSELLQKASENDSIGGYLMLRTVKTVSWECKDLLCVQFDILRGCVVMPCDPRCTRYDAVAVPVRNHSPFTYIELEVHARMDINENLSGYFWKSLIYIIVLFGGLLYVSGVLASRLTVLASIQFLNDGVVDEALIRFNETRIQRRLVENTPEPISVDVPISSPSEDERRHSELALPSANEGILGLYMHPQKPLWDLLFDNPVRILRILAWITLILLVFWGTTCLFYIPLQGIVNNLNTKPFWKERGVTISLTRPGRTCCIQDLRKHCVIFQYGLNGKAMV